MTCLYCGEPLPAPAPGSPESSFCSEEHRSLYRPAVRLRRSDKILEIPGPELRRPEQKARTRAGFLAYGAPAPAHPSLDLGGRRGPLAPSECNQLQSLVEVWRFGPQPADLHTVPRGLASALRRPPCIPPLQMKPGGSVLAMEKVPLWRMRLAERRRAAIAFWKSKSPGFRVAAVSTPLLLFAVLHVSPSKPMWHRVVAGVQPLLAAQWRQLGSDMQRRADIEFTDDFRHGLANWASRTGSKPAWTYDAAGFVHPGALALYRPTLALSDYRVEFLAQMDRQGFGFVFRSKDFDNYYAIKLVAPDAGPLAQVQLVRYAVVRGHEGPHFTRPLPGLRSDAWYRIVLQAAGHDFTLKLQGKIADSWSDARFDAGGIGFFCARGEQARLRMVALSHQNDALGKLCAFLKPGRS